MRMYDMDKEQNDTIENRLCWQKVERPSSRVYWNCNIETNYNVLTTIYSLK